MRGGSLTGIIGAVLLLALGGCDSASDEPTSSPSATAAPWAREIATGEQLWQASADGLTVTAYAMGEDTAPSDSYFLDDVTNAPLVAAGDRILFINLVLTNTSDTTQYIATDQPKLLAAPAESPYQQGVADITFASDAQWRDHGVWYHSVRLDSGYSSPYPLAPGESSPRGYVLPLDLGAEWAFIPAVWVYENEDDPGRSVTFEQQSYTFD